MGGSIMTDRDPWRTSAPEAATDDTAVLTRDDGGRVVPFRGRSTAPPDRADTPEHHRSGDGTAGAGAAVVGPVFDAEVVPDERPVPDAEDTGAGAEGAVPVDRHDVLTDTGTWLEQRHARYAQRQPLVPPVLRDRHEAAEAARFLVRYYAHAAAYRATQAPRVLLLLTVRAPRGAGRLLSKWAAWVSDAESAPLRAKAAASADTGTYLMLRRERDRVVRPRRVISAAVGLAVVVVAFVAGAAVPGWVMWAAGLVLLWVLGVLGAPADRPLFSRAVVPPTLTPLNSDVVLRALGSLGIGEINKALGPKGQGVAFTAPITRDGPGWRAELDLPYGVTALDVIERRDKLASGLRRPLGCVWPEPVTDEHTGRLVLWVGQQALAAQPPVVWPLSKRGSADLFSPLPFGADVRGRPVAVTLMFESVLIGAKPRMGKTFALRVLLLGAALDPNAEIHCAELKGTGDLSFAEKVAHRYGSGADDDTVARCLLSLRSAVRELETRAETIRRIAAEDPARCPENKVTPELAKAGIGLHPLVIAIDECQEIFAHEEFGKEAATLAEKLIKRGPAMGVILVLATQRPDAASLPTGVSANVGIRFCLRVMGQLENDMVLGTSSYKNGIRATMFTAKDKGIGYLAGVADDPMIVRTAYIDGPEAQRIAERARAMRQAAGTLAGYAIGQAPQAEDTTTVVDHLLSVWPGDAEEVWSVRLVEALAVYRPAEYGPWAEIADEKARSTQLAAALRPHGVATKQIKQGGVNKRGVSREALEKAAGR
jgi:S-DNA-T family DNA segregation ATPase FtsK/SpoIIIE